MISIVFFGSFQVYSVLALQKFLECSDIKVTAVVTTPPRPGNRGIITKTAVHEFCDLHHLPVFPLENLDTIPAEISRPDFIIVSGFGKFVPDNWLKFPRYQAINIHQSLLPAYAGRFPVEWAILRGETTTGVTLIKMSDQFDAGDILAQKEIPLPKTATREQLYTQLYELGAKLAIDVLPKIINNQVTPVPQATKGFYARQLTRADGFVESVSLSDPAFGPTLERMLRALLPWPGVWTYAKSKTGQKLVLKILSADINKGNIELKKVQIEGKKPVFWSEISSHYSLTS